MATAAGRTAQKDISEIGGLAAGRDSQDNKFKRKDLLVFNP
jgi:hypothetical protein